MSDMSDQVLSGIIAWLSDSPTPKLVTTYAVLEKLTELRTQAMNAGYQVVPKEAGYASQEQLDTALAHLNDYAQTLCDFLNAEHPTHSFEISPGGTKYKRIIRDGVTAYCFVNASGQIFKPAGWGKPAAGARALVVDVLSHKVKTTWHGGWLAAK